ASWQQRIRLYCRGKENGVNILKSIDEGPYQLGTVREALAESTEGTPQFGPERPRVYSDLTSEEKDRYNTDIWAANILLQGLPKDIYTLINHYTDAKDIWDNENKMMLEYFSQPTVDPLALMSNVSNPQHHPPSSSTSSSTQDPQPLADSSLSPAESLIENLTNTLALLTQSYKTFLPQTNNQLRTSSNARNQATALGFQNPCYLKKAQQLEPKLYDGSVIQKTNAIVISDSEETLMLEDESRSKMLQKQKDPMMSEKKVNTKLVDYAALNQVLQDFETRFVPQTKLSAEQVFWSQNSVNSKEPNLSTRPTIVEVPKELSKVSMVNSSLKKLKFHLANFDVVVKEKTTATAIAEGTWGFEHTKACFRDEIIPFVKALKDLFNSFDQFLIDELIEVQNVFNQIEQAVQQHCVEKNRFQDKMKEVLKENK
nr:integrase, catalytic region, zinc finger, CCHC-type, peptidase aspartic, catalytic [Tanacetum cinerariifolium]